MLTNWYQAQAWAGRGRIVAETIVGLLLADSSSYVAQNSLCSLYSKWLRLVRLQTETGSRDALRGSGGRRHEDRRAKAESW